MKALRRSPTCRRKAGSGIPQHNDMVSVGVVAEGKYLSRNGVRSPEQMFKREVEQNSWIKDHLSAGEQVGRYFVTSEFSFHASLRMRGPAARGRCVRVS